MPQKVRVGRCDQILRNARKRQQAHHSNGLLRRRANYEVGWQKARVHTLQLRKV